MSLIYNAAVKAMLCETPRETVVNHIDKQPTRFVYARRPYKGHRKGLTKRKYFIQIKHCDERYESAPFEVAVVPLGKTR